MTINPRPDAGWLEPAIVPEAVRPLFAAAPLAFLFWPGAQAQASVNAVVEAAISPLAAALSAFVFYPLTIFAYSVPWIVLWLAVAATFFTFYLGFINVRAFSRYRSRAAR